MTDWLADAAAKWAGDPYVQGALAALATLILEDPTTIACGLLVADGRMAFATAMVGVATGIALGDIGLYGLGRWAGPRALSWISPERVGRAANWFRHNLVTAIVVSRFVPGMRLPTYLAAGVLRAPWWRFVMVAVVASIVWTALLLWLTLTLGQAVLPLLGKLRWPVALAALVALIGLQRLGARELEPRKEERPVASLFEFWPPWLFYIPVGFYYALLALRYRGALLPSAANPAIPGGGLIGESKAGILDLVRGGARRYLARYVRLERPGSVSEARQAMAAAEIDYPLVAKPDLGQRGAGVQPIDDDAELADYLACFPADAALLLQERAPSAADRRNANDHGKVALGEIHEAGVLYRRHPDESVGRVTSITFKRLPYLVGDGRRTVDELIEADPRARRLGRTYRRRLGEKKDDVLAAGETMSLVFAGNHCQGAVFLDGTQRLTQRLERRIDEIAASMEGFHFGRFDILFEDLERFLDGEAFRIVEINGAGAEATHIWDASMRLRDAYVTLFDQFKTLFVIGAANRRRGFRPVGVRDFLAEALRYRRLARAYPPTL